MLPDTPEDWLQFLALRHDSEVPRLRALDAYYEGTQPLTYMHPDVMREVQDRIKPVVLFWPQLVVDTLEERLDVEGFRLPDTDDADEDMWRVWQANYLDEESQMGRVDALVMKRSYLAVGVNEDDADTPLVTVESPLETYVYVDPRTRKGLAALKRTSEYDGLMRMPARFATLYLPDQTVHYDWSDRGWTEVQRDGHQLGEVPVIPLVNRGRTADRYGRSELKPILPLSDAANKICTDMMVGAEFHAIPLRAIFGIGPDDLVDEDGNPLSATQVIMGRLLTIAAENGNDVKAFEWSASSLSNFHETVNLLAKMVAAMSGLPPHSLGFTTDNPASADAIRSSEARLVKRAERRQRSFGGSYERAMRLVRRLQTGEWDPTVLQLETLWRDASTPTRAQTADAVVKLRAEGIISLRQAREDIGYTDVQIDRMEADDAAETDRLIGNKPVADPGADPNLSPDGPLAPAA